MIVEKKISPLHGMKFPSSLKISEGVASSVYLSCVRQRSFRWSKCILTVCVHRYYSGPPLWSSAQSSWLQIQRSGLDSRCYQIFWEGVGLERGPLSLVSTIEELLERNRSGSDLESRDTAVGIRCADYATSYISAKVGTNFANKRRWLGRGLTSRSLVFFLVYCRGSVTSGLGVVGLFPDVCFILVVSILQILGVKQIKSSARDNRAT
jgi:hypothetical protein